MVLRIFSTMKIPLVKDVLSTSTTRERSLGDHRQSSVCAQIFRTKIRSGSRFCYATILTVDQPRPRQIVGIVGDVKHRGLGKICLHSFTLRTCSNRPFFPGATRAHLHENLVLRTSLGRQAGLVASVKQAIANIDPDEPISNVRSMEEYWRVAGRLAFLYPAPADLAGVAFCWRPWHLRA